MSLEGVGDFIAFIASAIGVGGLDECVLERLIEDVLDDRVPHGLHKQRSDKFSEIVRATDDDRASRLFDEYGLLVLASYEMFTPPTCWQLVDPWSLDVYDYDNSVNIKIQETSRVNHLKV